MPFAERTARRIRLLLIVLAVGAVLSFVQPVRAAEFCQLMPWGELGWSGVLGSFYGIGLRCSSEHVSVALGARSTQMGGGAFQPVGDLTYTVSPWHDWTLSLKTSVRDRIGDYEVNALPELSLMWSTPRDTRKVQFTFGTTWGSYTATTVPTAIQRIQFQMTTNSPVWQLTSDISTTLSLVAANDVYSTGDTQSWIELDWASWGRLAPSIDWYLTVGDRAYSGVSPLKFDGNGISAWTSAGLTFHVAPRWDLSASATYDFNGRTVSGMAYEVRTSALGDRAVTLGYSAVDQVWTGLYDLANGRSVGIRYDQPKSTVYAVVQLY